MTTYQQTNMNIGKFTEFVGESPRRTIPLGGDEARSLRRLGQYVRVVSGLGWLTIDDRDHILEPGDKIRLHKGKTPAVVGSANQQPVIFEVIYS
ncbi:MAG: hypothetical protein IT320_04590 [Anaerolineae bacterium]|nr:hypothetical protein [Anaerolineae bacterium]